MIIDPDRPRVRPVEAFPVQMDDGAKMVLRDPAGWSDRLLVVTGETLFVVSCLDGTQTLRDVQAACFRRFQEIVPIDLLVEVVGALDEALLLDSARFHAHREEIEAAFRTLDVRPASHAGNAYEADPDALRRSLDAFLDAGRTVELPPGRMVGLIAPHIDFDRGGAGYGAAYRALADRCRSDLFVVLGTAHASPAEPFTASLKAYDTPLGPVPADRGFLDALSSRLGERIFEDEIVHRSEHSIEFQALMLRHVFAGRKIRIVPILCSSFHDQVEEGRSPRSDPRVAEFLDALRDTLVEHEGAVLIAGVDLAHLGPRFGDDGPVMQPLADTCRARDGRLLDAAGSRDANGFFEAIVEEQDERRICGISAIYSFLETLPDGSAGTLLHYGQALDPERTTFVSFASMAFTTHSPTP